jgi:hypothetical protein
MTFRRSRHERWRKSSEFIGGRFVRWSISGGEQLLCNPHIGRSDRRIQQKVNRL